MSINSLQSVLSGDQSSGMKFMSWLSNYSGLDKLQGFERMSDNEFDTVIESMPRNALSDFFSELVEYVRISNNETSNASSVNDELSSLTYRLTNLEHEIESLRSNVAIYLDYHLDIEQDVNAIVLEHEYHWQSRRRYRVAGQNIRESWNDNKRSALSGSWPLTHIVQTWVIPKEIAFDVHYATTEIQISDWNALTSDASLNNMNLSDIYECQPVYAYLQTEYNDYPTKSHEVRPLTSGFRLTDFMSALQRVILKVFTMATSVGGKIVGVDAGAWLNTSVNFIDTYNLFEEAVKSDEDGPPFGEHAYQGVNETGNTLQFTVGYIHSQGGPSNTSGNLWIGDGWKGTIRGDVTADMNKPKLMAEWRGGKSGWMTNTDMIGAKEQFNFRVENELWAVNRGFNSSPFKKLFPGDNLKYTMNARLPDVQDGAHVIDKFGIPRDGSNIIFIDSKPVYFYDGSEWHERAISGGGSVGKSYAH